MRTGRRALAPADLSDPRLKRLIVRLAVPAVIGLSINAAHHTVNAVFLGMLGPEALAAVTISIPALMLIAAIGEGLGVGSAAAIGRLLGAGKRATASATASTVLALALPLGAMLTILVLIFGDHLLVVLGATPASLPFAGVYLRLMAFGAVLTLLQILCDFIAISEGNTRFSMWTLLSGFSLNIVLDPILILWTGFGVAGAALATIISRVAVLVVYALYFRRRVGRLRVGPGLVRPIRSLLVPVFAIGLPTTLTSLVTGAAFALVYAMAAELGGDDAVAAIGIAMRILLLGTLPLIGFVLGAQAVLSFAYGRRDFARLSEATRFMAAATFGAAVVYGLGIAAFADQVAGFFTADPHVRALAAGALAVIHLAFPFTAPRLVLLVFLQATARPRLAAMVSLAPQGYLLIPALLLLPVWFGPEGIALAVAAGIALAGLLAGLLLPQMLRAPAGGAERFQPSGMRIIRAFFWSSRFERPS
ncbi:MATE family efflux transporter [Roseibium salinum]|uniref:MATE family efflux transporter n=1 Tax=Roseibium salinum TaxID=1604349 RepID=A0ABT3QWW8_9HYPH|nr:MATE family efflux transporter [Roseibium sp. DSM 29163]MCX2721424.1 MATE family efflux transporter [Roseibium sp. DSM 29163]